MIGAAAIVIGLAVVSLGMALFSNFRGMGQRAATFGGAITFLFDGGQTLRRPARAYQAWGAVLIFGGALAVLGGILRLTG